MFFFGLGDDASEGAEAGVGYFFGGGAGVQRWGEVVGRYFRTVTEGVGTFDHVEEFADVAGPLIASQASDGSGSEGFVALHFGL